MSEEDYSEEEGGGGYGINKNLLEYYGHWGARAARPRPHTHTHLRTAGLAMYLMRGLGYPGTNWLPPHESMAKETVQLAAYEGDRTGGHVARQTAGKLAALL